ncbi:MAG: GNAT family N-acetyltransferase [Symbiobacteriia bacterium]
MTTITTDVTGEGVQKCAALYVSVFNAAPWNDQWTVETAYRRLRDIHAAPNFIGALCIDDGAIKGAVFGNLEQFFDCTHYNLREMFVSPDLQGTGVGSRLLEALEEHLKGLGVGTVYLFTSRGNQTSQFYQKNGFAVWESMAMMGKDLARHTRNA